MGGTHGGEPSGENGVSRSAATLLVGTGDGSDAAAALEMPVERANVLVVSATQSVADTVRDWKATGALPAGFGLVTFAEFERSASAETPARRSVPGPDITLTTMSDPGNLRRLGTAITLYLDDWTDTDRETFVYVDSLAPFVDANDLESTFQFLHLLVQSTAQMDARLVVRIDPSAVDDRAFDTLRSLFDDVTGADTAASPLDVGEIHDLLGNPRRRFTLRTLFEESALGIDDLATRLARWENDTDDPTDAERNRAYTALASVHVPRLAEAGVVVFDRANERVRLSDAARESDLEGRLD